MRSKTYIRLSQPSWLAMIAVLSAPAAAETIYQQHNLVSDLPGVAAHTNTNLANPWGIDWGPSTPFWISNNKTGTSTLYDGLGNARPLIVTIPPPAGATPPAAPTGVVFSGRTHFAPDSTGTRPLFLFASEDGTVTGWGGGTSAVRRIDSSPSGAVYKGIALSTNANTSLLYTSNFHGGTVDVFDANFVRTLPGSFADPQVPAGFAPFNVENIDNHIWVTYAMQDKDKHDDVSGAGHGYIDEFNTDGTLIRHFLSANPHLNSPWGMAVAPPGFGQFAGDLLVGNFGDGKINAFDLKTGSFVGQLMGKNGPIQIDGLWGLKFGNGGNAGEANTLFFTAGIPGPGGMVEDHGLFGSLTAVPEPGSSLFMLAGMGLFAAMRIRKRHRC
jgi:uncharacterized protein (TIGR03118 family)